MNYEQLLMTLLSLKMLLKYLNHLPLIIKFLLLQNLASITSNMVAVQVHRIEPGSQLHRMES